MTCIVGLVNKGSVIIGGDSLGSSIWDKMGRKDPKVFRVREFVIGFTSSFRMGQLLQFKFEPPEIGDTELYKYMVTDFVESVRTCFKGGGFAQVKDEVERGGVFLVGIRGRLFRIESDFQVGEMLRGYDAVGCGDEYALGVLYATEHTIAAENRVKKALAAAATFAVGVAGPFNILSTKEHE